MSRIAIAARVLVSVGLLAACASPAGSTSASSSNPAMPTATTSRPALPRATAAPRPSPAKTLHPGSLPQTTAHPQGSDPQFAQRMRVLWAAVVAGDTPADTAAGSSFFPLGAYLQVKAIGNPAADYRNRLIALYDLDIRELHRRVGPGAALLGVDVPDRSATWITPGQEYNRGSYWRVYGTRVRYRTAAGKQGSFGIFSLISWRGQWYVVHLGPINRPPGTGAVTP